MRAGNGGGWSVVRDAVRTQLWPIPAIGIVVAVLAGVLLPQLDARIDDDLPPTIANYLFGGGADAARAVLEAVAGSLITVTSLTFSLTVVTLQLASSQFSPRLLRTFSSDRFVQVTLGLFLGTFTYALTVLRTVRTPADGQALFVPQIAVTMAFVLAVVSVFALVLFLAHLAREIRVETMLDAVHRDATGTLDRVLQARGPDQRSPGIPEVPAHHVPLFTAASGFLVWINEPDLLAAAVQANAALVITRQPGNFLVAGVPIGVCWPLHGHLFDTSTLDHLRDRAAAAVHTGPERTAAQDIAFGLRQLTDVAIKALSPGINDPTTAIHALGHSSALLTEMAGRDLGPRFLEDQDQALRVTLDRPGFAELLELAIGQPRRYGAADPAVLARLYQLLNEAAWTATRIDHSTAIGGQLDRLDATADAQNFDPAERADLARLADQVRQEHRGRRRPDE
jgi:uncharacterized membrane protein